MNLRHIILPRFLVYMLPVLGLQLLILPGVWQLRNDPVGLKRYIYATAGWIGLAPYLLWALYLGEVLPPLGRLQQGWRGLWFSSAARLRRMAR